MLQNFLLVGLGGGIGAMLRYGITLLCVATNCPTNLGTMATNIIGSFVMGLLISHFGQSPMLLMATVGICGGFTTFSTFSTQSVSLLQHGNYGTAALYILGTVVLCIAFAALGICVGKGLG